MALDIDTVQKGTTWLCRDNIYIVRIMFPSIPVTQPSTVLSY